MPLIISLACNAICHTAVKLIQQEPFVFVCAILSRRHRAVQSLFSCLPASPASSNPSAQSGGLPIRLSEDVQFVRNNKIRSEERWTSFSIRARFAFNCCVVSADPNPFSSETSPLFASTLCCRRGGLQPVPDYHQRRVPPWLEGSQTFSSTLSPRAPRIHDPALTTTIGALGGGGGGWSPKLVQSGRSFATPRKKFEFFEFRLKIP